MDIRKRTTTYHYHQQHCYLYVKAMLSGITFMITVFRIFLCNTIPWTVCIARCLVNFLRHLKLSIKSRSPLLMLCINIGILTNLTLYSFISVGCTSPHCPYSTTLWTQKLMFIWQDHPAWFVQQNRIHNPSLILYLAGMLGDKLNCLFLA